LQALQPRRSLPVIVTIITTITTADRAFFGLEYSEVTGPEWVFSQEESTCTPFGGSTVIRKMP